MTSQQCNTDHDADIDLDDDDSADLDMGTMWLGGSKAVEAMGLTPAEFAELALVPTVNANDGRFWYSEHDLNAVGGLAHSIKLKRRWGVSDEEIERLGLPPVTTGPARQPAAAM